MPRYMVLNSHSPDECEKMEDAAGTLPPVLKGKDFYCTCPAGEHAYYMFLESNSSEDVMTTLPAGLKIGKTRAIAVDVWQL
ncbi:MAG: hypothetical protein ACRDJM_10400 [Actinomycetota bacterium]